VARQPARAPVCPVAVRAQPVRLVVRQPVSRPLSVHPVRPAVRRPAPVAPVVRVAPAPQRRQPAVPLPVVPVEVTRARVSPPPSSSRKRVAQAELPPPPTRRVSVFTQLSHPETAEETPTPPQSVVPIPSVPSVGTDVASSSTSDLGRR
ncbi:actin cytoskeleton-regulatory complex protein PAN1-like, partial [Dendrobium catenatum]|uniref:actin cytoskeleton-regulatory complex protein PAN1-like n=1 Tax=Dendrobium catenatum TaxID=906689 RepID=UPI00109F5A92